MENNRFKCVLHEAETSGTAVAAINILNYNTSRAVLQAAERAGRPIILQPSMGTVKRYGVEAFRDMIVGLRKIFHTTAILHLDHCTDENLAFACIRAGWDSVMVDYSAEPFHTNVRKTRQVVEYAHAHNVAVEGEIGIINGAEDEIVHEKGELATLEDTLRYIAATNIDAVAPAIGTAHGYYKSTPKLNFHLLEQLKQSHIPVVIHGGTGLKKSDFSKLIVCGASKINISTALKNIYLKSARTSLKNESISPLVYDKEVEDACSAAMEKFIRLFANEEVGNFDS